MKNGLFKKLRYLVAFLILLVPIAFPMAVSAATDADVTVTYTIEYLNIADNASTIDFGGVALSTTSNTSTAQVGITNNSTVQVDAYIGVTAATWTGATPHTHDDAATPGADTVGLLANEGGSWGAGDVIVKYGAGSYATWEMISENLAADADFDYGLGLQVPTSSSDAVQKTNTVRVTIIAG